MSFTRAAAELNVTQSAVSHSVREIETRLGAGLFVRDGRTLTLTEAGRLYFPFASDALARLRAGDRAVLDPQRKARVLTISVSPSFAAKWLVPRLGAFSMAHPDLDLRISANSQHVDFGDGEIDMGVRHGDGDWPRLHCTRLCEETLFSGARFERRAPGAPYDPRNACSVCLLDRLCAKRGAEPKECAIARLAFARSPKRDMR